MRNLRPDQDVYHRPTGIPARAVRENTRCGRTDAEIWLQELRFGDATNAIWASSCARGTISSCARRLPCIGMSRWTLAALRILITSSPEIGWSVSTRALAHVVRGVLDLAGLQFDAAGRCIVPDRS